MTLEPEVLPPLPPLTLEIEYAVRSTLEWRRDGNNWVLFRRSGRREYEMGRVFPDPTFPGMFRSPMSRGRVSDMANLSWAKSAVLEDVMRDLVWEYRDKLRKQPPNP